ncbi:MAG: hypothetical protein KDD58_01655 [Bdellovibrionales bacterium]|nr:hypothetical protein [Bdellovibrionales bacterium]
MLKLNFLILIIAIIGCDKKVDQGVALKDYSSTTTSVTQVSPSQFHTCALTDLGPLCWGSNWKGQLGDGTLISSNYPVEATSFPKNVSVIEAGMQGNTCVIYNSTVYCIGDNEYGQLGTDAVSSYYSTGDCLNNNCYSTDSVAVKGIGGSGNLTNVTSISLGGYYGCAVTTAGAAVCWGYNGYGNLGDGSYITRLNAVQVSGLTTNVTKVEASFSHACAIVDGGVKCWGSNGSGQLGDAEACGVYCNTPQDVSGLTSGSGVIDLALGYDFSCALLDTGAVHCWGHNFQKVVDASGTNRNVPTATAMTTAVDIEAGSNNVCAITDSDSVECWGDVSSGTLGDGGSTIVDSHTPVEVYGMGSGVTALGINMGLTACAIKTGNLLCWGLGSHGNLGNGSNQYKAISPLEVLYLAD